MAKGGFCKERVFVEYQTGAYEIAYGQVVERSYLWESFVDALVNGKVRLGPDLDYLIL